MDAFRKAITKIDDWGMRRTHHGTARMQMSKTLRAQRHRQARRRLKQEDRSSN